jgi:hypothetical protein
MREPIFLGEADYERWLVSALEAERQRLREQMKVRETRSPAETKDFADIRPDRNSCPKRTAGLKRLRESPGGFL